MKWYRYAPEYLGDGGIRIAGDDVQRVDDPDAADWIVVAQCLFVPWRHRGEGMWDRLWSDPIIASNPSRVVAFDCSDDGCRFGAGACGESPDEAWPRPPMASVQYFRCGLTQHQLDDYPSAIAWPWPSPDLGPWEDRYPAPDGFTPTSFVGWATPRPETRQAVESVQSLLGDYYAHHQCRPLVVRSGFHGTRHPSAGRHDPNDIPDDPALAADEDEYRASIFGALTVLCPQSIDGVLRYRVTEAMSAARIPVIIGDHYVLPFADRIPWDEISIQIPARDAAQTAGYIVDWINARGAGESLRASLKHTRDLGRMAQQSYRDWLHKDRFPELMATVLRERLAAEDRS